MTRKWFLSLLGIGAAGQTGISTPANQKQGPWTDGLIPGEYRKPKPRNGECPACGTMAGPYFPQPGRVLTVIPPINVPADPDSKIIRCAHCAAAFWQDAEGVK